MSSVHEQNQALSQSPESQLQDQDFSLESQASLQATGKCQSNHRKFQCKFWRIIVVYIPC